MRFAAVSDTHDNLTAVRELIEALKREKLDFVVHAGDVIAPFSLKEFEKLGVKLYVAFGNNDGERKILTEIANRNGWEIGDVVEFPGGVVYHGTDSRILEILKKLDTLVVFGHTHEVLKSENLLNPGEVCGYLTGRRTYAIIEDGEISIVEL
ncbi:MAG: YfcE family phosphodiesterase [Archaeoglobus sp.]|uniref:YfcE family phosphodiesterase n=1 Tax=Archaeoglobus sp. TaxID=1872626 RepID=UPI001D369912|nr:YfcE family phosphodiesterase [Archaeoglobus sp.]MBO8179024.1 YfcE family phosphodiesterase [Archaeoglobus sp.]